MAPLEQTDQQRYLARNYWRGDDDDNGEAILQKPKHVGIPNIVWKWESDVHMLTPAPHLVSPGNGQTMFCPGDEEVNNKAMEVEGWGGVKPSSVLSSK